MKVKFEAKVSAEDLCAVAAVMRAASEPSDDDKPTLADLVGAIAVATAAGMSEDDDDTDDDDGACGCANCADDPACNCMGPVGDKLNDDPGDDDPDDDDADDDDDDTDDEVSVSIVITDVKPDGTVSVSNHAAGDYQAELPDGTLRTVKLIFAE